jgi:hypothetical protein
MYPTDKINSSLSNSQVEEKFTKGKRRIDSPGMEREIALSTNVNYDESVMSWSGQLAFVNYVVFVEALKYDFPFVSQVNCCSGGKLQNGRSGTFK